MSQYETGSEADLRQQAADHHRDSIKHRRLALGTAAASGVLAASSIWTLHENGPNLISVACAVVSPAMAYASHRLLTEAIVDETRARHFERQAEDLGK